MNCCGLGWHLKHSFLLRFEAGATLGKTKRVRKHASVNKIEKVTIASVARQV